MAKNYVTQFRGDNYYTPNAKMHVKEEPLTPDEGFDCGTLDHSFEDDNTGMRKSLSMNDIAAIKHDLSRMKLESNGDDNMYRRCRKQSTTSLPQEWSQSKFVSMAEAIYHYHRDTPGRFHSTRPQAFRAPSMSQPPGPTIPQSPMLLCKRRSRPLHVMSQKEKEEMEIEEMRKHKIKANPIPKSVIEGSHLPEIERKPMTVPEPFCLTEVLKKPASPQALAVFKARPAPKHILEKPHIPPKLPVQVTKPVSPKFQYKGFVKSQEAIHHGIDVKVKPKAVEKPRQGPIRPEPFSFEKRDEELKRRREEKIRRVIEEERKQASQFKAQPLPGMVRKAMHLVTETVHKGSASTTSSENKEYVKFEARPPVVLYKEPFKPVLKPIQLLPSKPFDLTTTKRAAERQKFDQQLKEKEEQQEKLRLEREKENRKIEEKVTAELRAKLVHHPKPIPNMEPFVPEKSEVPITVPETPQCIRRTKKC